MHHSGRLAALPSRRRAGPAAPLSTAPLSTAPLSTAPLSTALLSAALVLLALPSASCATDEEPPPARMGAQPVPVSSPSHGGSDGAETEPPGDGDAIMDAPPADASSGAPAAARERPHTTFIYNRVLAKLADPSSVDVARLELAVEARTGAKVKQIKKGPMGLLSIIFEDVTPARGEAEQRALVDKLKGMQELRYAEPERLLQAR